LNSLYADGTEMLR